MVPVSVRKIRKVYIAGPWTKRRLIAAYAQELMALGYQVVSTWMAEEDGPHYAMGMLSDDEAALIAAAYIPQIMMSDLFICVTNDGKVEPGGGRHWESGFFIRTRRPFVLVGKPEVIFHALPEVIRFDIWRECYEWMRDGADPEQLGYTPFPPIGEGGTDAGKL